MVALEKPPSTPPGPDDTKYIHTDVVGRAGESPAERTVRESLNDHGRALQKMHEGSMPDQSAYPLDKDGED